MAAFNSGRVVSLGVSGDRTVVISWEMEVKVPHLQGDLKFKRPPLSLTLGRLGRFRARREGLDDRFEVFEELLNNLRPRNSERLLEEDL